MAVTLAFCADAAVNLLVHAIVAVASLVEAVEVAVKNCSIRASAEDHKALLVVALLGMAIAD